MQRGLDLVSVETQAGGMLGSVHQTNELADLLGPFWSPARVRAALGVRDDPHTTAQAAATLLALRTSDGQVLYPVWQFHRLGDGSVEVRPALAAMFNELVDFDPWAVAVLIHTPTPELDEETPLAAARAGVDPGTLASLARAVAREWAA